MEFLISEQPFVYREFLMYMQSIKGKSLSTVKEYALDLRIFFEFIMKYKNLPTEQKLENLKYDFVDT
ncbi:MAG: recombinase XerC, partial [Clostridia bacterium]|nr:recombinase XerC [Clostridia bacterium]